jgi:uncharacterized protein YeaO (DUF488 family)
MCIKIKRVYEPQSVDDGCRILVDRLWPRGMRKDKLKLDLWLKEVAPSDGLRKWFAHRQDRWPEFKRRYFEEMSGNPAPVERIRALARERQVTLLYAAKEEKINNAVALQEYLGIYRASPDW